MLVLHPFAEAVDVKVVLAGRDHERYLFFVIGCDSRS